MNLTEKQIEALYAFTQQHYVEHYDLQTELVDHLANDIEAMQKEDTSLTFEAAKNKSFKKFGVMGFMEVVDQKKKEMSKRYWRILWRFMKEWFTIPKILLTCVLCYTFFKALQFMEGRFVILFLVVVILVSGLIFELIVQRKINQRKKKKQPIFLLEEIIYKTKWGVLYMGIILVINSFNFMNFDIESFSWWMFLIMAFLLTLCCLAFVITQFTIPSKADELLKEQYPEYIFV